MKEDEIIVGLYRTKTGRKSEVLSVSDKNNIGYMISRYPFHPDYINPMDGIKHTSREYFAAMAEEKLS